MSNKINTTTGNEVKDMNATELEGKALSSTLQSGGVSQRFQLLVLAISNLFVLAALGYGFSLVGPISNECILNSAVIGSFLFILFLCVALAIKHKKESETSTEEQSAEVAKTEEVTDAKDEKPSNGLSNVTKFLLLAMGVLMTSVIIAFGFALLH